MTEWIVWAVLQFGLYFTAVMVGQWLGSRFGRKRLKRVLDELQKLREDIKEGKLNG